MATTSADSMMHLHVDSTQIDVRGLSDRSDIFRIVTCPTRCDQSQGADQEENQHNSSTPFTASI
jgi:hypothetical protein